MIFGKSHTDTEILPLTISVSQLALVKEWGYLGVTLTSGKFLGFSARPDLSAFYRATNAVLGSLNGAHEHVLLNLLYTVFWFSFMLVPLKNFPTKIYQIAI